MFFFLFEEKLLKNFLDTVINFWWHSRVVYGAPKQMPTRTDVFTLADSFSTKSPTNALLRYFISCLKTAFLLRRYSG